MCLVVRALCGSVWQANELNEALDLHFSLLFSRITHGRRESRPKIDILRESMKIHLARCSPGDLAEIGIRVGREPNLQQLLNPLEEAGVDVIQQIIFSHKTFLLTDGRMVLAGLRRESTGNNSTFCSKMTPDTLDSTVRVGKVMKL
jgi:hypothetical protein